MLTTACIYVFIICLAIAIVFIWFNIMSRLVDSYLSCYVQCLAMLVVSTVAIFLFVSDITTPVTLKNGYAIVYGNTSYSHIISGEGTHLKVPFNYESVTVDCKESTELVKLSTTESVSVSYTVNPDKLIDILNQYSSDSWRQSIIVPAVTNYMTGKSHDDNFTSLKDELSNKGINVTNIAVLAN